MNDGCPASGDIRWLPRADCTDEVQVQRQDGGAAICASGWAQTYGAARHVVASGVPDGVGTGPLLPALDVAPGATATLLELDFVCDAPGRHTLVLTVAHPDPPAEGAAFGAFYADVNSMIDTVDVATMPYDVDLDGDGTPEYTAVAGTLTVVCT